MKFYYTVLYNTGLCSRNTQVPQVTNSCLWVTRKTYFFQTSLSACCPQDFMVRNVWAPYNFSQTTALTTNTCSSGLKKNAAYTLLVHFTLSRTSFKDKGHHVKGVPLFQKPFTEGKQATHVGTVQLHVYFMYYNRMTFFVISRIIKGKYSCH